MRGHPSYSPARAAPLSFCFSNLCTFFGFGTLATGEISMKEVAATRFTGT